MRDLKTRMVVLLHLLLDGAGELHAAVVIVVVIDDVAGFLLSVVSKDSCLNFVVTQVSGPRLSRPDLTGTGHSWGQLSFT